MLNNIKNLFNRSSLLIAIVVTISIIVLSLIHIGKQPINFTYLDKVEHIIAYMVLSFLWIIAFRNYNKILIPVIGCIGLGILLEFLQAQTGYRSFDVNDMLANTIGVLIGMLLSKFYLKK